MYHLRRSGVAFLGCIAIAASSGCASIARAPARAAQRVTDYVQCVEEECALKDRQRQMQRQALLDEIAAEREEEIAELETRRQALKAEQELHRENLRNQTQESLQSKLSLNFDQSVRVGQLQVNTEQLKALIDQREKDHQALSKFYDEMEERRRELLLQQNRKKLEEALSRGDAKAAEQALADCSQPRPEALRPAQALKQPLQRPILPTEIPLMLPVTLAVGMENASITETRVRRQPQKKPCLREAEKGCQTCPGPGCAPACAPGLAPTAIRSDQYSPAYRTSRVNEPLQAPAVDDERGMSVPDESDSAGEPANEVRVGMLDSQPQRKVSRASSSRRQSTTAAAARVPR